MESSVFVLEDGYLDCLAEIVTLQNNLIDFARVQQIGEDSLSFRPCRPDQELPELYFGTPVKMNVYNNRQGLRVFSGIVAYSGRERLKVSGLEVLVETDRRQFLRVKTSGAASAYPLNTNVARAKNRLIYVNMEDISINGLQFSTPMTYERGDTMLIKLHMMGFSLELRCTIKRVIKGPEGDMSYYYGCQYNELTRDGEETLHRLLLRLQQNRRALLNS
jgi:hypothetical protein